MNAQTPLQDNESLSSRKGLEDPGKPGICQKMDKAGGFIHAHILIYGYN